MWCICTCICVSAGRANHHFELSWRDQTEHLQLTCWGKSRHNAFICYYAYLPACIKPQCFKVRLCLWSLQELLLCPVWRMQEYVTLLQALSLHTHPGHPDHAHLRSALNTLLQFREFIHKVKHELRAISHVNASVVAVLALLLCICTLLCSVKAHLRGRQTDRGNTATDSRLSGKKYKKHI